MFQNQHRPYDPYPQSNKYVRKHPIVGGFFVAFLSSVPLCEGVWLWNLDWMVGVSTSNSFRSIIIITYGPGALVVDEGTFWGQAVDLDAPALVACCAGLLAFGDALFFVSDF